VALDECLAETLSLLDPLMSTVGAQVLAGSLPTVSGDQQQLGTLFQELLNHLLEPRGWRSPLIQISARPQEDSWLVSVRDNGHGVGPAVWATWTTGLEADTEQLAGSQAPPAPMLSPAETVLEHDLERITTCRDIIESHGGRAWLETHSDVGTTWWLCLPGTGTTS